MVDKYLKYNALSWIRVFSQYESYTLTTTSGAQFCRAESKIDRGQAEQILDTLATLHGMFLGPYRDVDVSWLRTYESFFHAAARNGIEKGHDLAMIRAADVIPPSIRVHKARIWPAALESLAARARVEDCHPF